MVKISVIMGVFNGEDYLSEAIESILNQTYGDFEFIICDDGSTDKSINIIDNYYRSDNRIVLIRNEINMGLAASLNKCIGLAKGEYIARMDCDDISLTDRFEKQVSYLENNTTIDIVGGCANLFDENGIYGSMKPGKRFTRINVFKNTFFIHPSVMMRRDVLLSVGGYTVAPYTYRTEDYDLWCKLYEKGCNGVNLDEVLLNYRQDRKSYSKRKFKYRIDAFRLRRIWYKRLKIPLKYMIYIYKPIFVGLIPIPIMRLTHRFLRKSI
jgi:glycosyltransferase EpsE